MGLIDSRVFSSSRTDPWWIETLSSAFFFSAAIIYSLFRALEGRFFQWGPYVSPLYPIPFDSAWVSPAMLTMWIPAGFRITCYFCRRVYYRSIFADPPACMVREPKRNYKGESALPYVLLNLHRYFLFLALIFVPIHWLHTIKGFVWNGGFGAGLGSFVLLADSVLLTLYVLSCHSLRHLLGGGVDVYSKNALAYKTWSFVTFLNRRHGLFFWLSLASVVAADLYVRLLSAGLIKDPVLFLN